jgi:hypothetical protein
MDQLTELDREKISSQADDAFSTGCIIAEIYLSRPLLGALDILDTFENVVVHVFSKSKNSNLPLPLKRGICLLLHPNPLLRPRLDEMLQFGSYTDPDFLRNRELGLVFTGEAIVNLSGSKIQKNLNKLLCYRKDIIQRYCNYFFPSYFSEVYSFISAVKLGFNRKDRLDIFRRNILHLKTLCLDGIMFALPHILTVLEDTSPFTENAEEAAESYVDVVLSYTLLVDFTTARLGIPHSDNIIVPRILKFFRGLTSPTYIQEFLVSDLWRVLILRIGVKSFLRNFLPILLTYLVCSNFQDVVNESLEADTEDDIIPVVSFFVFLFTFSLFDVLCFIILFVVG